jgi:hypothetical protein
MAGAANFRVSLAEPLFGSAPVRSGGFGAASGLTAGDFQTAYMSELSKRKYDYWEDIFPAAQTAEAMLEAVDQDMSRLPEAVRVFLSVNGAQGAMDNGGFVFFFGADWPGTPPYEEFIVAYEAIGCVEQAAALRRIVATFPFADPHLHKGKRKKFIEARYDKEAFGVPEWGSIRAFGQEVWEKLAEYHRKHKREFA